MAFRTEIPVPKDDEVVFKMSSMGYKKSWFNWKGYRFMLEEPIVYGLEISGTVIKTGRNVTNFKEGDRMTIEPGVPCRICTVCEEGRYNLCKKMVFCRKRGYDCAIVQYYAHPADFCLRLPDNVTLEEGGLLEPLSLGIHACKKAGIALGSVVLIFGAGAIGIGTLLIARAMSASKIIILDEVGYKLYTAKKCGADHTLLTKGEDHITLSKKIQELLGEMPDKTIDCLGLESTTQLGIEVTRPGGKYVLVVMASEKEVKVPLAKALKKEVDIVSSFRHCNDYRLALDMVSSGKVNVKPLIRHDYEAMRQVKFIEDAMGLTQLGLIWGEDIPPRKP